jgi:hypothetical protein
MKFLIAAALAGLAFNAAGAQELGNGKTEYMNSCAVCHGPEGKGDGPLGDELVKRPADLTRLSRDNGGAFPYWRVFAMIDGRTMVPEHGDRDMPVWAANSFPTTPGNTARTPAKSSPRNVSMSWPVMCRCCSNSTRRRNASVVQTSTRRT